MPPEKVEITSFRNEHLKNAAALRFRKARDEQGLSIIEGWREVNMAHAAGLTFEEIYLCPELFGKKADRKLLKDLMDLSLPTYEMNKEIFAKISFGDRQEGILVVFKPRALGLGDLKIKKKNPLLVIVEKVEKPGNLGAILRSCDGAGADALIVCDRATDIYNPNVIRASLGTVFSVPVVESSNELVLQFLKKNNISVCATLPEAKSLYSELNFRQGWAIVVGSEQEGLSGFWQKEATSQVKIPMAGWIDSLNVATTTAVVLYEAIRQRAQ